MRFKYNKIKSNEKAYQSIKPNSRKVRKRLKGGEFGIDEIKRMEIIGGTMLYIYKYSISFLNHLIILLLDDDLL